MSILRRTLDITQSNPMIHTAISAMLPLRKVCHGSCPGGRRCRTPCPEPSVADRCGWKLCDAESELRAKALRKDWPCSASWPPKRVSCAGPSSSSSGARGSRLRPELLASTLKATVRLLAGRADEPVLVTGGSCVEAVGACSSSGCGSGGGGLHSGPIGGNAGSTSASSAGCSSASASTLLASASSCPSSAWSSRTTSGSRGCIQAISPESQQ
mmetsp:Transcript_25107/g.71971  ORF Transcript_25107/g.71971 Transcript_25107/m.71971 type:complete len:213 (-) Transcript_25107:880-1518(-)